MSHKPVNEASTDLGFLRLAAEPWSELEDISIDYAIMEKAQNLVAVPYASKWSDLGGWDAVWSESKPDAQGMSPLKLHMRLNVRIAYCALRAAASKLSV